MPDQASSKLSESSKIWTVWETQSEPEAQETKQINAMFPRRALETESVWHIKTYKRWITYKLQLMCNTSMINCCAVSKGVCAYACTQRAEEDSGAPLCHSSSYSPETSSHWTRSSQIFFFFKQGCLVSRPQPSSCLPTSFQPWVTGACIHSWLSHGGLDIWTWVPMLAQHLALLPTTISLAPRRPITRAKATMGTIEMQFSAWMFYPDAIFLFRFIYFSASWVFTCMYVCVSHVCGAWEARGGHRIPWNWSYRLLGAPVGTV